MSKHKKKKSELNVGNAPQTEDTAAAETAAAEEEARAESEAEKPAEAETRQDADNSSKEPQNAHQEEFTERKISDSENKRIHERFKFDWELEEHLLEALDEDASELAEPEEAEPEPIEIKSISLTQAVQAVFGLFLLIFAAIGVIATAFKVSDVIKASKDTSAQQAYFEDFLMPLVASDAPIFDGASSLNEDVIITAACWDIILNPSVYYEYSNGIYSVSYIDIDRRITKLFGPGLSYTHKTVGDTELTFEYDGESGMYYIPAYPRAPAYCPEVTAMNQTESGLELTVCYRLPITNWIDSPDTVEKIMIYTVVPTDSDYNVTAIRIGEIGTGGEEV